MQTNFTDDEAQYVLGLLKEDYDAMMDAMPDMSAHDQFAIENLCAMNRAIQEELLEHEVRRAGYRYR